MRNYSGGLLKASYGDTSVSNPNGLESYVVEGVIGRGSKSVIHVATCTRGRLRGRKVALKIITLPLAAPDLENFHATTALHKSLHHPALVSLHSSFTSMDTHYLVLEFCEGGTLWNFLQPPSKGQIGQPGPGAVSRLTEAQLRSVLRSIVEGLSHLHARGIIHRAISLQNVHLTADGRAKLGGSRLTIATSTLHTAENACPMMTRRTANCASPEMITKCDYSHSSDLWYLGCLIITVLTGSPPFELENASEVPILAPARSYTLDASLGLSEEIEGLIHGLLKIDPCQRTPLEKVLAHPFFNPSLPTQSIRPSHIHFSENSGTKSALPHGIYLDTPRTQEIPSVDRQCVDDNLGGDARSTKPRLPYRMPSTLGSSVPTTVISKPSVPIDSQAVSRPLVDSACSTPTASGIRETWAKLTTRQQPRTDRNPERPILNTTSGGVEAKTKPSKRKALVEVGNRRESSGLSTRSRARIQTLSVDKSGPKAHSGLLSPPETHYSRSMPRKRWEGSPGTPSRSSSPPSFRATPTASRDGSHSRKNYAAITEPLAFDEPPIPIPHTNFPKCFQVPPLFPQTYKIVHGQLVVMPSRSLLVDLREGERRAGGRGNRVMCISPDGREIKVYDAPHLSTPCILSEPLVTWNLDDLPDQYWENYTFASKFVESVKKRTPRMIWYTPQAKFTLMSNGPKGDIHASFPCPSPGSKTRHVSRDPTHSSTTMKIKLSREEGLLEISRYVSSPGQLGGRGEWVAKSLSVTEEHLKLGGDFGLGLTPEGRQGLSCVIGGLKVYEAAEGLCMETGTNCEEEERASEEATDHPAKPDATENSAQKLLSEDQLRQAWTLPSTGNEVSKAVATRIKGLPLSIVARPRRVSSAGREISSGKNRLISGSLISGSPEI